MEHNMLRLSCPACGGELKFRPHDEETGLLVCGHCGYQESIRATQEKALQEQSLLAALEACKEQGQFGIVPAHKVYTCQSCGGSMERAPEKASLACPFCGAYALAEDTLNELPLLPQGVLPFKISMERAQVLFQNWAKSLWFAPLDFVRRLQKDLPQGAYIPIYTFDAQTYSLWYAEAGYYRTRIRTRYNPQTQREETYTETYIEWFPVQGTYEEAFDDVVVAGLSTFVHFDDIAAFDTADAVDYDGKYFLGIDVLLPKKSLAQGWQEADKKIDALLKSHIAAQVPGDTHRNLFIQTQKSHLTFRFLYVPVYVMSYTYGSKTYTVLINGRTGVVRGARPISAWKVALAIVIGLIAVGLLIYLSDFRWHF
ncbi:MAG: hypothetical protein ACUVRD_06730 [Bacteroidia bacterium]